MKELNRSCKEHLSSKGLIGFDTRSGMVRLPRPMVGVAGEIRSEPCDVVVEDIIKSEG